MKDLIVYDSVYMQYPEHKNTKTENRLICANGCGASFWGGESALKFDGGNDCTTL